MGCCCGGGGGDLVQPMYVLVNFIRLKLFSPSFGALPSYWSIHVYDRQNKGHHIPSSGCDNMRNDTLERPKAHWKIQHV